MKIVVVRLPDGRYRFKVLDAGQIVMVGAPCADKAAAEQAVADFRAELAVAAVEDGTVAFDRLRRPVPGSLPPI